jgi:MFS family permease
MAVGNLLLGRLGDARGHLPGIAIGYGAQIVALIVLLTTRGVGGCILAYLAAGFCSSGTWVSHTNMVIEACPHDYRTVHIAAANMVMGLSGFAVPLIAGAVAGAWGLRLLFMLNVCFSVAALVWVLARVRDPRRTA